MKNGFGIVMPEEKAKLSRIAAEGSPRKGGVCSRAAEILACVNDGVLPSQSAVDWFILHFRTPGRGEAG